MSESVLLVLIVKFHIVILCMIDDIYVCLLIEVIMIKQSSTRCNLFDLWLLFL